jgi:prepilin-type N-terminal cleavage/methylation domain-containing protein
MHPRSSRTSRRGFTLIELMVVIIIIVLIAGIAAYVAPRLEQSQKATRGASQLSSWLLIAKQRALRDRVPTGLRLIADANNLVREVQYVQQPDPFTGGSVGHLPNDPLNVVTFTADLTGGFSASAADQSSVQPGDYLEVQGGGQVYLIKQVTGPTTPGGPSQALLSRNFQQDGVIIQNYRILRQPRRLAGEEPLPMPQDVVIDFSTNPSTNLPYSQNAPIRTVGATPFAEIMFSPSGGVVGQGTATADKIILWVRDATRDNVTDGEPVLVSIQVRTGMVASNPVDVTGTDKYSFTRDPRASGM